MRVLFVTMPIVPHFYPMAALAWAFRAAGHDVRVAGQPAIHKVVTGAGLPAVSIGDGYNPEEDMMTTLRSLSSGVEEIARFGMDDVLNLPDRLRRRFTEARIAPFVRLAEVMARDLVAFVEFWKPDLIISDPLIFAAPIAAEISGVPLVRNLWGPDVIARMNFPGQSMTGMGHLQDWWPEDLVELYRSFNVKVRSNYAAASIDPCPTSLQLPGVPNRVPMRYVPYNGSGVLPSWLTEHNDRRRVCVTWGTSTTRLLGESGFLVPQILDALRGVDVEVVLAIGEPDRHLIADSTGVRIVENLPLNLLLPTCSLLVHPGGAGTMLTAATLGVPQVILPQIADQHVNAAQLAATGAGVNIPPGSYQEGIETAIRECLSERRFNESARRLRRDMLGQPTPASVVEQLLALEPYLP
ncbi:nucleotide disphospho-sugar-binding domain-containing protein [Dactylosporangium cerinum]|uniref:Nucleotide disphospho-sugar-binding domain-containing protein n=1 Tax=Dactylosporangium cerinum TaxID=1434730 RepID=A0ABV9VYU5_9ACTN